MPAVVAIIAGITDWRSRRIPNWLTVTALLIGIVTNSWLHGWAGAKTSLLGAGLGLLLLLPFVLIRSLGAGDWKLVGALGAFFGSAATADGAVRDLDRGWCDGPSSSDLEGAVSTDFTKHGAYAGGVWQLSPSGAGADARRSASGEGTVRGSGGGGGGFLYCGRDFGAGLGRVSFNKFHHHRGHRGSRGIRG